MLLMVTVKLSDLSRGLVGFGSFVRIMVRSARDRQREERESDEVFHKSISNGSSVISKPDPVARIRCLSAEPIEVEITE